MSENDNVKTKTTTIRTTIRTSRPSPPPPIPILDARHLLLDDPLQQQQQQHQQQQQQQLHMAQQLGRAFHETGFVLIQHHLDDDLCQRQLAETRAFFARSLEEKLSIAYEDHANFRGYMRMGVENTAGKTDYREQVEFAVEYAVEENENDVVLDDSFVASCREPVFYQRLKGRNPWPDAVQPSLKNVTEEYVQQIRRIADGIRRAMCMALGLDAHSLDPLFDRPDEPAHWVLKLIAYPANSMLEPLQDDGTILTTTTASDDDTNMMGVGAHTDTNFLTLILQDTVGGLQIWHNEQWLDVPARSDCLVVNLGEQAQLWSRGYFAATPHRVVLQNTQQQQQQQQPRISVPFFYNPILSAVIQPVDELPLQLQQQQQGNESKSWQPPSSSSNYLSSSVGENTFKSLARSHPAAFAKHHSDLRILPDGRIVRKNESRCE